MQRARVKQKKSYDDKEPHSKRAKIQQKKKPENPRSFLDQLLVYVTRFVPRDVAQLIIGYVREWKCMERMIPLPSREHGWWIAVSRDYVAIVTSQTLLPVETLTEIQLFHLFSGTLHSKIEVDYLRAYCMAFSERSTLGVMLSHEFRVYDVSLTIEDGPILVSTIDGTCIFGDMRGLRTGWIHGPRWAVLDKQGVVSIASWKEKKLEKRIQLTDFEPGSLGNLWFDDTSMLVCENLQGNRMQVLLFDIHTEQEIRTCVVDLHPQRCGSRVIACGESLFSLRETSDILYMPSDPDEPQSVIWRLGHADDQLECMCMGWDQKLYVLCSPRLGNSFIRVFA